MASASLGRTSSPARMVAKAFRRSRRRSQHADFHWIGTSEEFALDEATCVAAFL